MAQMCQKGCVIMTTIRKFIAMILFVSMYALRNKSLPNDELTSYIVSQTYAEPWGNMPRNAWAWADTEVAEAWTSYESNEESNEPSETEPNEHTVVRWDADNGRHALRIYDTLISAVEWGFWHEEFDNLVFAKAELFWANPDECNESDESDELPEWATAPIYDLDDDECWF